jgi:hypothetical protein
MKKLIFDNRGTSVMEFGLIAPALIVMLMGTLDAGQSYYVRAVLNGSLNQAARASALEGNRSESAKAKIKEDLEYSVQAIAPGAAVDIERRFYRTFSEAALARAETIIEDSNNNGKCDVGETYVDANLNNAWDADGGNDGQGGARDVVIIKVNVRYTRLFPVAEILGFGSNVQIVSDSILANQPYGAQEQYTTAVNKDC